MTLEEITELEYEWLDKRPCRVKDLHTACEQMGIYDAWRNIFEQYVILARKGELEALKRALFLYWYSRSEPQELCGIPMLDEDLIIEVLGMVNDMAQKGEIDIELSWMLPYYYSITDWYIDRLDGFHELKKVSKENKDLWREISFKTFTNRGQLGNYWNRIW